MKIKTTKTMNLPQLIEHIVETSYECNKYIADNAKSSVYVGSIKGVVVEGTIFPTDTFTVEVEEEITKDTVIPMLVSIGRKNENDINIHHHCRISQFIDNKDFNYYVLNDDDTLILIWRDGKLIKE